MPNPRPVSIDGIWIAGTDTETELIRRLCRSAITGSSDARIISLMNSFVPARLEWLARQNRAWFLIEKGLQRNALPFPNTLKDARKAAARTATMINSLGLTTLRKLMPEFAQAGIPALVMKGPMHQRELYGTFFSRISSDVDLLVPRNCFSSASALLKQLGYTLPDKFATYWWRQFLGEQHFVDGGNSFGVVDLHWKVQQPGCPAPSDLHEFFSEAEEHLLGTTPVRTLSRTHATLLTAMSLVKAILNREPAGAYAADLALAAASMTGEEQDSLRTASERLGLSNTVSFALQASELAFGVTLGVSARYTPTALPVDDRNVPDMVLRPELESLPWPRRGAHLWSLCDGRGAASRAARFTAESFRSVGADICRRAIYQVPSAINRT